MRSSSASSPLQTPPWEFFLYLFFISPSLFGRCLSSTVLCFELWFTLLSGRLQTAVSTRARFYFLHSFSPHPITPQFPLPLHTTLSFIHIAPPSLPSLVPYSYFVRRRGRRRSFLLASLHTGNGQKRCVVAIITFILSPPWG
ncbi:hypothetical protein L873DRAFT_625823 [Choiromyces venosus 120613-1]|uniref:Uncharacterized protein n=1 Tax=Choiromyces venosus 120613-1 TaxID=1336337 RepID=A0A3N4IUU0_9PEZI|nr:hypothetical protein L873DRAFT_625823 [Choiromyces venosus 120613-1]